MKPMHRWWIYGTVDQVALVLPKRLPFESHGCVYVLSMKGAICKIGRTECPGRRIPFLISHLATYGDRDVQLVALSHPSPGYKDLERRIHAYLRRRHLKGELFRCTIENVERVIGREVVSSLSPPPVKDPVGEGVFLSSPIGKVGRTPKPWYWTKRQGWYLTLEGRRFRLGSECEEAWEEFVKVMSRFQIEPGITKDRALKKMFEASWARTKPVVGHIAEGGSNGSHA